MAKCKFCGQGVRTAPVFHPACWPNEVKDQRDLIELHCSECIVAELLRLGGNEV